MRHALLLAAFAAAACCKTCPPLKVVVQTLEKPCLEAPLIGLLPVARPAACREGMPCTTCLPSMICYDLQNHVALRTNLELLLQWKAEVEARCLKR